MAKKTKKNVGRALPASILKNPLKAPAKAAVAAAPKATETPKTVKVAAKTPEIIEDADGSLLFSVKKINTTWKRYGLTQQYLSYDGKDTPFKAIVRERDDVSVLAIVRKGYTLLPNEEVLKVSDSVATAVGAVPFDKFTGDWFCRVNSHVFITGKQEAQQHALYAFNEPFDTGDGDTIQLGFAVHNSIDGSMGLCASLFTFRHACANMAFMGFKGQGMNFDEREALSSIYKKHTSGLDISFDGLRKMIEQTMKDGTQVLAEYMRLRKEILTLERARKIAVLIPKRYWPVYMTSDEKTKELKLEKAPTLWETYNDLTAAVWYTDKTGFAGKQLRFDRIHQALGVKVHVPQRS